MAIETARKSVAKILNAHPAEIFFTSGGTESSNTAIQASVRDLGCRHIITSPIEHHAVSHTVDHLDNVDAVKVSYVKLLPNGHVDLDDLEKLLAASKEKTAGNTDACQQRDRQYFRPACSRRIVQIVQCYFS